jgi:hypothetical protein
MDEWLLHVNGKNISFGFEEEFGVLVAFQWLFASDLYISPITPFPYPANF